MRRIAIAAVAAMMVALAMTGSAWGAAAAHYGPYASSSTDEGTCGNTWANDTFNRAYTVKTKPTAEGKYNVVEQFKKGTFTTLAGQSPGACQSGTDNGSTLSGTVTGKMQGSFSLVVSGGTYNSGATCSSQCITSEFVAAFFGAGATYEVTSWNLHYSAKKHGVWKNASPDKGGNSGDITG
jgi:hypothetical protein